MPVAPLSSSEPKAEEGCLKCGHDDDHSNLLLCEGCNDEYHTYCLNPPLRNVPSGDWFCGEYRTISTYDFLERPFQSSGLH